MGYINFMVFSSVIFLFMFLPTVLLGNFLLKKEYRNYFLLIMSLGFYAFGEPKLIYVMLISICINYFSGILIHYGRIKKSEFISRFFIFIGISLNLLLLFYFKYFGFFTASMNDIFNSNLPLKEIILPIGISFFTFQGMSYIIDLYRDKVPVQKNICFLALYVTLFPQLIAGPIVRYIDINGEIRNRECSASMFTDGISRFVVGLAKKMIIANHMGLVADKVFELDPTQTLTTTVAWIGAISYTFQIYFDFSGYSDMAIGLGKMLGFNFLENFNYPYISKSITEFWRRWHISLSSWFRDYVYIPLGGNRRGNVYFNLTCVFLVTGLWHGASFNFIVWGLWHGLFIVFEKVLRLKNISFNIPAPLKWVYTMLVVIIGWVIFRAVNITFALEFLKVMFGLGNNSPIVLFNIGYYLTIKIILITIISIIASVPLLNYINNKISTISPILQDISSKICLIVLFMTSIILIMTSTYNPFIYFRF